MAMENLSSVFIGIVDILGHKKAEQHIDQYGPQAASAKLGGVYNTLNKYTLVYNNNDNGVRWLQYLDGYVFYSETNNVAHLATMIKDASKLIALSLIESIPLRIAITQGDIKIIKSDEDGLSVTGSGWTALQKLENSLDWMGGWLYLPSYDNHHHPTVTKLISTTHLIVQQNCCSEPTQNFTAPFKGNNTYSEERAWFLNWHKVLHQQNHENEKLIKNWWLNYTHVNINGNPDVQQKQKNTIAFAHYCNILYQSANLIYHSKVVPDLKISEISSSN